MHWEVGKYMHDPNYFSAEAVDDEDDGEGEYMSPCSSGHTPRSARRRLLVGKTEYWTGSAEQDAGNRALGLCA